MSLQSRAQIGRIIRNARIFDVKNWSGDAVDIDSLLQSVDRLFAILSERKINYVLVGGVALLNYIEGRNTEDIDLIMALSSIKKIPEVRISSQDVYFARGEFGELAIDILLTRNPLFEHVLRKHTVKQQFREQSISVATVEGLLLLKLYALPSLYRQGNFSRVGIYENDIATLLQAYQPAVEPLLDEISSFIDEADLSSLRDIIAEIGQRIARFRKASGEQNEK